MNSDWLASSSLTAVVLAGGGLLAILLTPRYGMLSRLIGSQARGLKALADDFLALLYRAEFRREAAPLSSAQLRRILLSGRVATGAMLLWQQLMGYVRRSDTGYRLTESGRQIARQRRRG